MKDKIIKILVSVLLLILTLGTLRARTNDQYMLVFLRVTAICCMAADCQGFDKSQLLERELR